MRLEEIVQVKVTLVPQKKRNQEYWDLERKPEIKAAVEKCLATGEEQFVYTRGEMLLYHVRPGFPLIESAMAEDRNKSLVKVSVSLFTAVLHLGVRDEHTVGR